MTVSPREGLLTNLQATRALAALGVVVFHFGLMPATSLPFTTGAAGVDLFFVLSGFIIAHSSARDPHYFLARRLIRVVPAYWIATLIAALFTLPALRFAGALDWLIQSMFYLPGPGGRPALIFVAWTLVYELAFYLLYWVALHFGARRAPVIGLVILLMLALVRVPGLPGPWPLLIEFGFGIVVYLVAERQAVSRAVPASVGLLIAATGLALLLTLPRLTGYDPNDYQTVGRVLSWGLPASVIILGLVAAEHNGRPLRSKTILLLGAASYAIYLLHPIAIGQLMQLPPNRPPFTWLCLFGALAATVALSLAFHLWIETPVLRWMRSRFRDRPPAEQHASLEALTR